MNPIGIGIIDTNFRFGFGSARQLPIACPPVDAESDDWAP